MERACPFFAKCISTLLRASYSLGLNTNYIISVIQSNGADPSTCEMSQMHNEIWHGTKALILICPDTWSDEDDLLTLTDKWDEHRVRNTQEMKKGRKVKSAGKVYVSREVAFIQWEVSWKLNQYLGPIRSSVVCFNISHHIFHPPRTHTAWLCRNVTHLPSKKDNRASSCTM